MASIIIDVDEVKNFRAKLLDRAGELKEQLARTESAIEEVSEQWRDNQFEKFKETTEPDKEIILSLCKKMEEIERDVLLAREQLVRDEYLSIL